jgi:hypoxanthine phosphoribosyltransferase
MLESKTGILIVDDIVDSGTTLHEINDYSKIIERDHPDQWVPVTYAVCVKRAEIVKPVPNIIFGTELESFTWVNFPWGE